MTRDNYVVLVHGHGYCVSYPFFDTTPEIALGQAIERAGLRLDIDYFEVRDNHSVNPVLFADFRGRPAITQREATNGAT